MKKQKHVHIWTMNIFVLKTWKHKTCSCELIHKVTKKIKSFQIIPVFAQKYLKSEKSLKKKRIGWVRDPDNEHIWFSWLSWHTSAPFIPPFNLILYKFWFIMWFGRWWHCSWVRDIFLFRLKGKLRRNWINFQLHFSLPCTFF